MDPRPLWDPAMMGSKATWLHGSSQGLSEALQANKSKTVAVVGNGPISDKQRLKISEADIIVRFNAMNNRSAFCCQSCITRPMQHHLSYATISHYYYIVSLVNSYQVRVIAYSAGYGLNIL